MSKLINVMENALTIGILGDMLVFAITWLVWGKSSAIVENTGLIFIGFVALWFVLVAVKEVMYLTSYYLD